MNKPLVATLAVLSIAVAGCSSSKSGSGKVPTSSAAGSSSAPTTAAASSAASQNPGQAPPDKAALAKIVVQQADLPAGWTATPHQSDPSDAADQAAMVRCVGGKDTDADKVAEVDSPDFGQNDASISSSATSFKSRSDIEADVALLKSPKISTCYEQLAKTELASSLPSGSKLDAVSFTVTPGPGSGPSNVAATGKGHVTVTVSGQQLTIYLAVAFITGPLTEVEIDIENPGQPVPESLFSSLVQAVAGRASR